MQPSIKPEPAPHHLCWRCRAENNLSIRTFKIASCTHFDVPEIEPEEVKSEEEDVVVDDNTFANRATPPELKTEKFDTFNMDVADQSSSSSDDSVRNHIRSKL